MTGGAGGQTVAPVRGRGSDASVMIGVGTRLVWDGELRTVVGLAADGMLLRGPGRGIVRVQTTALLADPSTRVIDGGVAGAAQAPPAIGPLLEDLDAGEDRLLDERLGHVREVLTGYASGCAEQAAAGEPRAGFDPRLPLKDRYAAKAAELGVDARTVRRWVGAFRESGTAGLVDGRWLRGADVLSGVDERWLAMCRAVVGEHAEASRPTKELVLARIAARLDEQHGPGRVPVPGVKKARRVLEEITRGSNAFTGSTKGKRSIAARPQGVYGRLRATRPGEYLLLDTTPLDVFAMEPLTLRWVRVELTIAMDLFSRSIVGLRLAPASTKAVDAAVVLFETLHPGSRRSTGAGLLPYAGLPQLVVVDGESVQVATSSTSAPSTSAPPESVSGSGSGLPGVAAETVVVDHGKIYLSRHLLAVCERLAISVQPARPLTPTDKAAVERFFRTLGEGLLAALPGYKGPDIHSRGADPEGCTYFFLDELEQVIREWVAEIYHRRPHAGLVESHVPGLELSPEQMFEAGIARAGRLRIPTHPGLVFDFLPTAWRTIQHYGVEVHGLRYNGPALTAYRNRTSPFTGAHAGKWPVRYDPDDVCRLYFQDPADQGWHELAWEHAEDVGVPFSAETLAYARRLALASGRHGDERRALADLLHRWDAGLVRHPAERRMAVRASQQRHARLSAAMSSTASSNGSGTGSDAASDEVADVLALPSVAAVTSSITNVDASTHRPEHGPGSGDRVPVGGDDDCPEELLGGPDGGIGAGDDVDDDADGVEIGDEEFYAEALGVLR